MSPITHAREPNKILLHFYISITQINRLSFRKNYKKLRKKSNIIGRTGTTDLLVGFIFAYTYTFIIIVTVSFTKCKQNYYAIESEQSE